MSASRRIGIEYLKADALRKLRLHLTAIKPTGLFAPIGFAHRNKRISRATEDALADYLAVIVQAHISPLVRAEIVRDDINIEACVDSALEDAKQRAKHPLVDAFAAECREEIVDAWRAEYLKNLHVRLKRAETFPIHSVVDFDPEEHQRSSDALAAKMVQADVEITADASARQAQQTQPFATPEPTVQGELTVSIVASPSSLQNPGDIGWHDIEIVFLDELTVQVFERGQPQQPSNYVLMGFEDRRTVKPNLAWEQLRELAANNGTDQTDLPD